MPEELNFDVLMAAIQKLKSVCGGLPDVSTLVSIGKSMAALAMVEQVVSRFPDSDVDSTSGPIAEPDDE